MDEEAIKFTSFKGVVWRIMYADQQDKVCEPVSSPVGRFHYSEQSAIYTSCTEEGAKIAIKRYVKRNDQERIIVPLAVDMDCIYDLRNTEDSLHASIVWQDIFEENGYSPTWKYSDRAREAGAQGMLYSSRSRPDVSHLVLFQISEKLVRQAGDCRFWNF